MYKILVDKKLFCDSRIDDLAILNPEIDLEKNKAGTFTFTMPHDHPYYDTLQRRKSHVEVYRDDDVEPTFAGICVGISDDFFKQRTISCEGELTYLNDTIQRPAKYQGLTVRGLLETYIAEHNKYADEDKQFTVGEVTVKDSNDYIYCYTNYETTMDSIFDDLIDDYGGYLRIRHENDIRYLDYLADSPNTCSQSVRLSENLLDLETNIDLSNIATCIIPLGADLEESTIQGLNERVTIKSVNDGVDYIVNEKTAKNLGIICKVVTWTNVTQPDILKRKAIEYLNNTQFDNLVITANAIDLHFENKENEHFHLLDKIPCVSKPHGIDRSFVLSKMTINLNDPEADTITLGEEESSAISEISTKDVSDVSNNVSDVENNVSDLNDAINGEDGLSSSVTKTNGLIEAEVKRAKDAEDEISTKVSMTPRSVSISATGGENSVGITIQMYDENGNVITSASDQANIVLKGVVTMLDLATAGATTINGANITTGIIKASDSEFARAKFYDGIYYALSYNGTEYKYPVITIPEPGDVRWCNNVACNTTFSGTVVFSDSLKRVYLNSASVSNRVATMGDIPSTSDFAAKNHNHNINNLNYSFTSSYNVYFYDGQKYAGGYRNLATTGWVSSNFKKDGSDIRLKKDIKDMPDISELYMLLEPKSYEFKEGLIGYDNRTHYGLIAQPLEALMNEYGLENTDLVHKVKCDGDLSNEEEVINDSYVYRVNKDELHAMHIQMIQKQQKRIEALEDETSDLKDRVEKLEKLLSEKGVIA